MLRTPVESASRHARRVGPETQETRVVTRVSVVGDTRLELMTSSV